MSQAYGRLRRFESMMQLLEEADADSGLASAHAYNAAMGACAGSNRVADALVLMHRMVWQLCTA